jgi:LPS export ABC transporter permease LptG/LPS export ABC transporter permease LptF
MRIFTQYVLREVTAHALIGAGVFTFVIFMKDVTRIMELVVRNSAPGTAIAEIFLYTLPTALTFTIPMGVLVGILIGLSRLAADSEVTAMRACGIGAGAFVRMLALFGAGAWLLALGMTAFVAPRAESALVRLTDDIKGTQAAFEVQPRVFYEQFKNYVLYVQDASASGGAAVWKQIFLADVSTPGAPRVTTAARGVVIRQSENEVRLHLEGASQHEVNPRQPGQYVIDTYDSLDMPLPIPEAARAQAQPLRQMPTVELWERAHALAAKDQKTARTYLTEFYRRLALPTSCLVLMLVGVPLGLSSKRGGKAMGFVLTILLVLAYYVLLLEGVTLAQQGKISPEVGAWTGNAVFLIAGLVLLWKADHRPVEIGSFRGAFLRLRHRVQRGPERAATGDVVARARRKLFPARFPLLLDDYILRDFLMYLGLILGAFLVLMLVFTFFELVGDIVRNRVALVVVGEYLANVTPYFIYQTLPLCVLLAVLITLGLMQKGNEITAMKATGISVYRVVVPVFVIAGLLAVGLFFFDQWYLPYANKRQDALRNEIKGKPPQTFLRPDRKWIFGQHDDIYYYDYYDSDRNQFGALSVFSFDPKTFQIVRRVYATHARWEPALQKWVLEQGWERAFNGSAIEEYRTFDAATFAEINEPPSYFKKEVKQSQEMNYAELKSYIEDLQQSGFDVVRLRVQLYRKLSFPLITLVMAILAVPFALSTGRRGAVAGVAVAVGIGVVYWAISGLFEALGNVNQLPAALAAWSPDLIFALVGGYLILKLPT